MFGKKKKSFKEMTVEEFLKEIPKISTSELYQMGDMRELSYIENEAINNELDRRVERDDKISKGFGVSSIIVGVIGIAVGLIFDSGKD